MSKKAMKLALEALEANVIGTSGRIPKTHEAITALREALAEQPAQQEPVAWMDIDENGTFSGLRYWSESDNRHEVALYTSPPPQRKPLTEEVKNEFWIEAIKHGINGQLMNWQKAADFYADAIEAAHGIKGDA